LAGLNVAPTLAPISNQTIPAGRTLFITNVAGDILAPPQILTYSLQAPPAGATINFSNGVLSWRPTIVQGGTTNQLTVMVSNNGLPVLNASQSFTINVLTPARPAFANCIVSNGLFQSWIMGDWGPDYSIFGSTNLTDWQLISTTNQPQTPFLFTDPVVGNRQEWFYRICLGP
jgi:hypothetical protein